MESPNNKTKDDKMSDKTDASSPPAALAMMQQELPQYLQNMLLACGYDRLQIIAEMNVNTSGSCQQNDVDKMLDYIKQTFPSDSRFCRSEWGSSQPDIPPGHRILISNFVRDVQKHLNIFKGRSVKSRVSKNSKVKAPTSDNVCYENDAEDLASATSKVRNQIVKWLSNQSNIHLRQLREYKEYKVKLKQNANASGSLVGAILCIMCNSNIHLAVDHKNNVKLSNWIRHVKQCVQQKEGKDKGGKDKGQLALTKFFSGHSSSSDNPNSFSPESEVPNTDDFTADDANDFSDKQGFQLAPPIVKK